MSRRILIALVLLPFLLIEFFLGFETFWGERIMPGIWAGLIPISGYTQTQASQILKNKVSNLKRDGLRIQIADKVLEISLNKLEVEFDVEKTTRTAYQVGHSINLATNFRKIFSLAQKPVNLKLKFSLNQALLDEELTKFAKQFETPILESRLEVKSGQVQFTPGKARQKVDTDVIKQKIFQDLENLKLEPVTAQVLTIQPEIPQNLADKVRLAASKFVGKKIKITAADVNLEIDENQILKLLSPAENFGSFELLPNKEKVENFVQSELVNKISRSPEDAKLQFAGGKVVVFQPSVDGILLDTQKSIDLITQAITTEDKTVQINLPVNVTLAKIKTEDINNWGISELVGRGVSNFAGSAAERIHNIKLATSRINGTLIPPGETFSFNSTVGEISQGTGYTSAYIISKGRTILGEGGGVCQVSTTAFRAAADAGLEIVKRTAHAYRVRYYEQAGHPVGLDATIFIPTVDFQFKNDTQNHILIQAYTQGLDLYFDFYGTKDGRLVEVSKPQVTNVRSAPDPLYEPDDTLPVGTTKQVDFAAIGSTVEIRRTVRKDGQILHFDKFLSNYQPWQAVYKVGTKV